METTKRLSVAFTGHRTYAGEGRRQLDDVLRMLYSDGYRRFLTGMAWGFDLAAARAVIDLRRQHDDVRLVAVEPYAGFRGLFSGADADEYDVVLAACDERVTVCANRSVMCYRRRNDFLVEHAAIMLAYWDGLPYGGTYYTIGKAQMLNRIIINLYK